MALYRLPRLFKTEPWEVSGEAQKFLLQLVLWSLSLDPSPQHPWWVAETRTHLRLPAQAWASATAPQLTLIRLLLWDVWPRWLLPPLSTSWGIPGSHTIGTGSLIPAPELRVKG